MILNLTGEPLPLCDGDVKTPDTIVDTTATGRRLAKYSPTEGVGETPWSRRSPEEIARLMAKKANKSVA